MADSTDSRRALDLDALAVSDRFRLFNFTRRDDHVAYLWVLRALDRLRAVHQVQAHTDDVAAALRRTGRRPRRGTPAGRQPAGQAGRAGRGRDGAPARGRLPGRAAWPGTGTGSRSTSSASSATGRSPRWRTCSARGSGTRTCPGWCSPTSSTTSRRSPRRTAAGDEEQVYRRLSRLDTVMEDMSRRSAQFHLTLGEIITVHRDLAGDVPALQERPADPHDRLHGRARPLPAPAGRGRARGRGDAGVDHACCAAPPRPTSARSSSYDELLDDWRRRWAALRAWFAADARGIRVRGGGPAHRHPGRGVRRDRAAPPGHRGAARRREPVLPAPPPRRMGVQHARRGRRLRADVGRVQPAGRRGTSAARTTTPSRSPAAGDLVGRARRRRSRSPCSGGQGADARAFRSRPRRPGGQGRTAPPPGRRAPGAEREAAQRLLANGRARPGARRGRDEGAADACSPGPPRPARSSPAGWPPRSGGNDVLTMRLVPSPAGSAVRTANGVLHLPGFALELVPRAGRR